MTRTEANEIVAPFVYITGPRGMYRAVSKADALALLGEDRYARLLADPIRGLGPSDDAIYAWNVTDYVQHEDLRKPVSKKPASHNNQQEQNQ